MYNTKEEIENWLKEMKIEKYRINKDLTIDVDQCVKLILKIKELPVKFNIVKGDFFAKESLTTLKGFPEIVQGDFFCQNTDIENLDNFPREIHGRINLLNNKLTSLKGIPSIIYNDFSCKRNKLTSLQYCSQEIRGDFHCSENLLTDLKYFPQIITRNIDVSNNQLTTLEHINLNCIDGDLRCNKNNLISLKGCPQEIKGSLSCRENNLTSLEYVSNKINTVLDLTSNKINTLKYFPKEYCSDIILNKNPLEQHNLLEINVDLKNFKRIYTDFNIYGEINKIQTFLDYEYLKKEIIIKKIHKVKKI